MKQLKFLSILLLACSCQYFETEKISSDTFYEEEIKAIDWKQVDRYPAFSNCTQLGEKEEQKRCFETTLSSYVYKFIEGRNLVTQSDLNSTIQMDITISKSGEISNLDIKMDSSIQKKIPLLKDWLAQSIDSLPELLPAHKQGIPVETVFRLPVVIHSEKITN